MSRRVDVGRVTVRQYDPGSGWTLQQARRLLEQGYLVGHVEQRTGWPRPMLLARAKRQRSTPGDGDPRRTLTP